MPTITTLDLEIDYYRDGTVFTFNMVEGRRQQIDNNETTVEALFQEFNEPRPSNCGISALVIIKELFVDKSNYTLLRITLEYCRPPTFYWGGLVEGNKVVSTEVPLEVRLNLLARAACELIHFKFVPSLQVKIKF